MNVPALLEAVADGEAGARYRTAHVVTVTHNSASTLDAYFAGIDRNADAIGAVTVVDNASGDRTVARLRELAASSSVPVEVIENDNAGFAGGYAAAARGRSGHGLPVLALNPDVALHGGAVSAMLDLLDSFPSAAVVTVPLVESDGTPDSASRRRLPTLGPSVLYSVLGRFTPGALRYNARVHDAAPAGVAKRGTPASRLEATTGAVMLVAPDFRTLEDGIFDRDYWMYGEDLQLCADAAAAARSVLMAETPASVHVKGVSSGRPRSHRSNRAFHDAMSLYARKNLVRHPALSAAVRAGVFAHFAMSELRATPARLRRRVLS